MQPRARVEKRFRNTSSPCSQAGWVLKAVYFAVFCVFVLVTALSGAACSAKWASYTGKLNGNEVGVISVILPKSVEVCSPSGGSTVCTTRDNDASTLYVSSAALSGYKGTYALSIITAIAGGFGIATSLALLLIELGVLKVARKLLTIVTVVLGWLAVATSAAACVAFGAGVHPNFVNGQALFSGGERLAAARRLLPFHPPRLLCSPPYGALLHDDVPRRLGL